MKVNRHNLRAFSSLNSQDDIFRKKFTEFRGIDYPEVNPIELVMPSYSSKNSDTVKLYNYRMPASD